MMIPTTTIT